MADVNAALNDIGGKVRNLVGGLSHKTGIDGRTRQLLAQTWAMRGMQGNVVEDCKTALVNLDAAIDLTRASLTGKSRRGRKTDPKQEFTSEVYGIFRRFKIEPLTRFENILSIILTAAHDTTGDDNIHRLAMTAAKHPH